MMKRFQLLRDSQETTYAGYATKKSAIECAERHMKYEDSLWRVIDSEKNGKVVWKSDVDEIVCCVRGIAMAYDLACETPSRRKEYHEKLPERFEVLYNIICKSTFQTVYKALSFLRKGGDTVQCGILTETIATIYHKFNFHQ